MNTLLNYPGAKWGMASWICSLMPPHRSYLEPFFGSGAVLFSKKPSAIETINDIDGDIVNFFSVLREQPQELADKLALTPYARDVFDDAHANKGQDPFDRAYRFAIRSKMGHGFKTYQKTGFKIDVHARENSYAVKCWNRLPGDLLEAAERLNGNIKLRIFGQRNSLDNSTGGTILYADNIIPVFLDTMCNCVKGFVASVSDNDCFLDIGAVNKLVKSRTFVKTAATFDDCIDIGMADNIIEGMNMEQIEVLFAIDRGEVRILLSRVGGTS